MELKLNISKISIIDTHAHLEGEKFAEDFDAMITRAAEAGVNRIITAGTNVESSEKAVALARRGDSPAPSHAASLRLQPARGPAAGSRLGATTRPVGPGLFCGDYRPRRSLARRLP